MVSPKFNIMDISVATSLFSSSQLFLENFETMKPPSSRPPVKANAAPKYEEYLLSDEPENCSKEKQASAGILYICIKGYKQKRCSILHCDQYCSTNLITIEQD